MRILFIAVSVLLASCNASPTLGLSFLTPYKMEIQQGNLIAPEMREKVKVGMSAPMVRSILGTPLINDPFHASRWDYVYTLEKQGKLLDKQRLTLYFDGERLARIDDSHMPAEAVMQPQAENK